MKSLHRQVTRLFARTRPPEPEGASAARRRHIEDTAARDDARKAAVAASRDLPRGEPRE